MISSVQSLSHVWLCNPMDCSTPGFPVHHQLPEFIQTHVHRISDAIKPSYPLLPPSPPVFNLSQHQGLLRSLGCHSNFCSFINDLISPSESFYFVGFHYLLIMMCLCVHLFLFIVLMIVVFQTRNSCSSILGNYVSWMISLCFLFWLFLEFLLARCWISWIYLFSLLLFILSGLLSFYSTL